MGDAVTALSTDWSMPAQEPSLHTTTAILDLSNREPGLPASDYDSASDHNVMTVNSAILTGNTPSAGTGSNPLTDYNSGGAQNLVRMVEDWFPPQSTGNGKGMELKLNGSLGQLFTSKYFTGHYTGNTGLTALGGNPVYTQPPTRDFDYDTGFKDRAPAGAPTTTGFTRGDFFFW
jgi:hypothetical protein